jgi:hypothetical protein
LSGRHALNQPKNIEDLEQNDQTKTVMPYGQGELTADTRRLTQTFGIPEVPHTKLPF